MSDLLFEVLTSVVAIAAGAAWYKEFLARRKLQADLAVEKQMRRLDEVNAQLELNRKIYEKLNGSLSTGNAIDRLHAVSDDRPDAGLPATGSGSTTGDAPEGTGGV